MFIDSNIDVDLGMFLLEKKAITIDQLKEATVRQKIKGGYLSRHLIDLGYLKDSALATYLTCQYGYSYLPLKAYDITEATLAIVGAQTAVDYAAMPIERNDKLLTVAMADPLNRGVVEMLRRVSNCEIVVFVSALGEIMEAINRYYGQAPNPSELDQYQDDQGLRDDLVTPFVSNDSYAGVNRRRYKRFNSDLELECHIYPNTLKTKAANLSMGGILFTSSVLLPKGLQLACRIKREREVVDGVLEVVRYEAKAAKHLGNLFEIGAFFTFMTRKDQNVLADLLRRRALR